MIWPRGVRTSCWRRRIVSWAFSRESRSLTRAAYRSATRLRGAASAAERRAHRGAAERRSTRQRVLELAQLEREELRQAHGQRRHFLHQAEQVFAVEAQ